MRVTMIDPGCFTPAYNNELCNALSARGINISLITAPHQNDNSFEFNKSFSTIAMFFNFKSNPKSRAARRLKKLITLPFFYIKLFIHINRNPPNAVHFQWLPFPIFDYLFIFILKRYQPGLKMFCTIHDADPAFPIVSKTILRKSLSLFDGLIVHGQWSKERLIKNHPTLSNKTTCEIPHGPLYLSPSGSTSEDKTKARQDLGICHKDFVLLFIGELKAYKGLDILIEAIELTNDSYKNAITLIVAGKVEDDEMHPLLNKIENLPIKSIINTTYIPDEDFSRYFTAADCVTLPYKRISQSGILLTAISNCRPVIVSDIGEIGEATRKLNAGWTFQANNSHDLKAKIESASRMSADALDRIGKDACKTLIAEYGWDTIARKTEDFYLAREINNAPR